MCRMSITLVIVCNSLQLCQTGTHNPQRANEVAGFTPLYLSNALIYHIKYVIMEGLHTLRPSVSVQKPHTQSPIRHTLTHPMMWQTGANSKDTRLPKVRTNVSYNIGNCDLFFVCRFSLKRSQWHMGRFLFVIEHQYAWNLFDFSCVGRCHESLFMLFEQLLYAMNEHWTGFRNSAMYRWR